MPMDLEVKLHSRRLRLRTGVTLRCTERAGDGPTVLLLHGYSDSGRSFEPIVHALPQGLRVLALDQRGHGDSDRPAEGYDAARLATDAAALLDATGVRTTTVVGHSMGGFVAQELALAHPERVSGLVLVASAAYAGTEAAKSIAPDIARLTDPVPYEFVRALRERMLHRPIAQPILEQMIAESRKMPAWVWRALFEGILGFDARERLEGIACPTLLVWGAYDTICGRAEQEWLLSRIPGAALKVYEDAGHAPHWEEPQRFARELAAFVAGAPLGRAAPDLQRPRA
jgi:non-heme chloroperoxidase